MKKICRFISQERSKHSKHTENRRKLTLLCQVPNLNIQPHHLTIVPFLLEEGSVKLGPHLRLTIIYKQQTSSLLYTVFYPEGTKGKYPGVYTAHSPPYSVKGLEIIE